MNSLQNLWCSWEADKRCLSTTNHQLPPHCREAIKLWQYGCDLYQFTFFFMHILYCCIAKYCLTGIIWSRKTAGRLHTKMAEFISLNYYTFFFFWHFATSSKCMSSLLLCLSVACLYVFTVLFRGCLFHRILSFKRLNHFLLCALFCNQCSVLRKHKQKCYLNI